METPPMEEQLKKLIELEENQQHLKQEMSRLKESTAHRQRSLTSYRPAMRNIGEGARAWKKNGATSFRHASPLLQERRIQDSTKLRAGVDSGGPSAGKFTNQQYLNILQSIGQAVHAFDLDLRIIFWNAMAEKVYGHSAAEVVGRNPINVIVDDRDAAFAMNVTRRCVDYGESWTGEFPVKGKSEEIFSAVTTVSPFYDDDGSLFGIICITVNTSPFLKPSISARLKAQEGETSTSLAGNSFASKPGMDTKGAVISKLGLDSDQPIKAAIASKISSLASKVRSKMQANDISADSHHSDYGFVSALLSDQRDGAASSCASTPREDVIHSPFGVFTYDDEKFLLKPSKGSSDGKSAICKVLTSKAEEWIAKKRLSWPWKGNEQERSKGSLTHSENEQEKDNEASSPWFSSINSNSISSTNTDSDSLEYEILWDDLTIGERIGQGSYGTLYHGLWFGSDVAVKVFSKQEYSEEVLQSFRQEVSLMKRLRHPNVLLFMGAVTSPQHLSIVSEFLPRGSLFLLLQRSTTNLDWRRRINIALDIARGINYLHCCSPPIVHRDLKSSNLLVDKNWTVKVADFGLSRIKHETYLTSKSGKGTPQWMAPEVLRNESADEKSDIYSFGVVLWELATGKIPWETLNSMQVIGTVGFMNQRLETPKDIDPCWISLMESCWHSDTKLRPTFRELMEKLRDMKRKYTVQSQATHDVL